MGYAKVFRLIQLCVFIGALLISQLSTASFTDSLTIGSAKALSLGHAVTADPPGIDSIHFNPAGLTRLKGKQRHIKLLAGDFSMQMNIGDYGPYRQQQIDRWFDLTRDENGQVPDNIQQLYYNETINTVSKTEGVSTMIPGVGMVDLPVALAPLAGFTFNPPGSKFTFGTNVYTPLMVGFNRSKSDPGHYLIEKIGLTLLTYFSPTVAYEVSERLSVGVSVNFNYAGLGVVQPFREPHDMWFWLQEPYVRDAFCTPDGPRFDDLDLCGQLSPYGLFGELAFEVEQPLTLGVNLGLLWEPTDWLTLGVAYNSRVKMDMEGDYTFPSSEGFRNFYVPLAQSELYKAAAAAAELVGVPLPTAESLNPDIAGKAYVKMELPQHMSFGLSAKVTPRLKLNVDLKWGEWSALSGIPVGFDQDIGFLYFAVLADALGGGNNLATTRSLTYPLGLKDTWNWALGMEFQYNDRLRLRAGLEWRPAATRKESRSPLIPLDEGTLYGAGFEFNLKKDASIDFGVGYFSTELNIPACSSDLGNGCDPAQIIYSPYIGQDVSTELNAVLIEFMYQQRF